MDEMVKYEFDFSGNLIDEINKANDRFDKLNGRAKNAIGVKKKMVF